MVNHDKVQALPTNLQEANAGSANVEGIIAGLIGAAILALWFLMIDTLHGRPLYTPSMLGSAIFRSNHAPSELKDLAVSIEMTISAGLIVLGTALSYHKATAVRLDLFD